MDDHLLRISVVDARALNGVHQEPDVNGQLRLDARQLPLHGLQLLGLVVRLLFPGKENKKKQLLPPFQKKSEYF